MEDAGFPLQRNLPLPAVADWFWQCLGRFYDGGSAFAEVTPFASTMALTIDGQSKMINDVDCPVGRLNPSLNSFWGFLFAFSTKDVSFGPPGTSLQTTKSRRERQGSQQYLA